MTEVEDLAEKIIGGYWWKMLSEEAKQERMKALQHIIKEIMDMYSNKIRHVEIGDAWFITEDELRQIENKLITRFITNVQQPKPEVSQE